MFFAAGGGAGSTNLLLIIPSSSILIADCFVRHHKTLIMRNTSYKIKPFNPLTAAHI
jgi:hypothetical protein